MSSAQQIPSEKQDEKKKGLFSQPWMQSITGIVAVAAVLGGILWLKSYTAYVPIEDSRIAAPLIKIGPKETGTLSEVYVKSGEQVTAGQQLARVGSEVLIAQTAGLVVDVVNVPGQVFTTASPVVTMIDPAELQVTGEIEETKGLSKIRVGQTVGFTVDAFDGRKFVAVVSEISPTSDESSVVFSISDKREIKKFQVKAKYDEAAHPEFRNGMSAKMKVYTKE